jgi:hypothetical protein
VTRNQAKKSSSVMMHWALQRSRARGSSCAGLSGSANCAQDRSARQKCKSVVHGSSASKCVKEGKEGKEGKERGVQERTMAREPRKKGGSTSGRYPWYSHRST